MGKISRILTILSNLMIYLIYLYRNSIIGNVRKKVGENVIEKIVSGGLFRILLFIFRSFFAF